MKGKKVSKKQKFSKGFIFAAILVLVLAGAYFIFISENNSMENVVAVVNDENIMSEDIEGIQQMYMQQGQQISEEEVIEQAVFQTLLSQEMDAQGIEVADEEAEAFIKSQLSQQNFTLEQYKSQLESQGLPYESHLDSAKEQLRIQAFLEESINQEALKVTVEEAEALYDMYVQQSAEEVPSYEELESQIIMQLQQQKQQEAINSLLEDLKSNSEIEYF